MKKPTHCDIYTSYFNSVYGFSFCLLRKTCEVFMIKFSKLNLIAVVAFLIGANSFAQNRSYLWQKDPFLYEPAAEILMTRSQGTLEFPSRLGGEEFSRSELADSYDINILGDFSDEWKFKLGVGFQNRRIGADSVNYNVSGMKNLEIGVFRTKTYDTFSLNYGLESSLSLAPAQSASLDEAGIYQYSKVRNNFTGYNSFIPYLESEFAIGKFNNGVRGSFEFYQSRFTDKGFKDVNGSDAISISENRMGLGIDLFSELKMNKRVATGISAGASTTDLSGIDKTILNGAGTAFRSRVYATYQQDADLSFILGVASESRRLFYNRESTEVSLGLKQTL